MVTSAFSSVLVGDPSQDWNMDMYDTRNADPINHVSGLSTSKNGKKGIHNASTAPLAITGYPSDFPSGETDSRFTADKTNIMHSTNNTKSTKTAKSGKNGNYGAPAAPPLASGYRDNFQSADMNPSYTPNNTSTTRSPGYTNAAKDTLAVKNANRGKPNSSTASPASPAFPSAFQSGDADSSFTHNTDTLYNTNMNGMNNVNSIHATKSGKKSLYHQHTAPPASATYPGGAFQSRQVDTTFNPADDTMYSKNSTNNTSNISNTKKGNTDSYHSSSPRPAAALYSSAVDADEIDSSYGHNTGTTYKPNTNSTSTTKNSKKGNNQSSTTRPATSTYSSAFQSDELDSRSTPTSTYATSNTNTMNTVNTTKNAKKNSYEPPTSRPSTAGYPGAYHPRQVDTNSGVIAEAWEEHIDVATNRSFFYNSITKRSTWGQPSGMVKKAPPPPPSPPPMAPIVQRREQDQWFRIRDTRGRKIWYNEITRRSQVERPDCLRKYR